MITEEILFRREDEDNFKFEIQIFDSRKKLSFFKDFYLENKDIQYNLILTSPPRKKLKLNEILDKYLYLYNRYRPIILDIERIFADSNLKNISNYQKRISILDEFIDPIYSCHPEISIENFPRLDKAIIEDYIQQIKRIVDNKKLLNHTFESIVYFSSLVPFPFYINLFIIEEKIELAVGLFNLDFIRHADFLEMEIDSRIAFIISLLYHYDLQNIFLVEAQKEVLRKIIE